MPTPIPLNGKSGKGPISKGADNPTNYDWWNSSKDSVADDMVRTAKRINERQASIRDQMLYWARLHGGSELANLTPTSYARPAITVTIGETVGLNIIENMCSAAQAEVCASKPKVMFSTDDGDWYKQQEAQKLTRFCDGQVYQANLHTLRREVVLDACIFGTGILKVFENPATEEVAVERIFPWELLVDRADGFYGKPMCMYQTKYVDRAVLKRTYKKQALKIEDAHGVPLGGARDPFIYDTTSDMVQVVEAWRRPTAPGRNDGRHVIAVDDILLLDEEWDRDPPFVFWRWLKRPFGFWGKGLAEQLSGIQREINRLLMRIQKAFARLGITRIYIERGSKVNPAHMRSNDGDIVEYTGQKPTQETPATINPEVFNHLWRLKTEAFQITGISEMSAQGQAPPPGVDSGRAIRTLLQNHSKRFNEVMQQDEENFIDINRKMVAVAKDIANREVEDKETGKTHKHGYIVKWMSGTGMESIDLADVELEDDEYVMRPFPTSALPDNPGEKMQVVQEWFNSGMVDASTAMMLMDIPETTQYAEMQPHVALWRAVFKRLTDILEKGKAWVVDSFVDPDYAKSIAIPFLLNAEQKGAPPDRLDLIRQAIEDMSPEPAANDGAAPGPGAVAPGGPQLAAPAPGEVPPQVNPIGPMNNPMQPKAA